MVVVAGGMVAVAGVTGAEDDAPGARVTGPESDEPEVTGTGVTSPGPG